MKNYFARLVSGNNRFIRRCAHPDALHRIRRDQNGYWHSDPNRLWVYTSEAQYPASLRAREFPAQPSRYGADANCAPLSAANGVDYKARFYSSLLGRFRDLCAPERSLRMGEKPDTLVPGAGNPQMFNRYAYSNNNPINYTDPSGHKPTDDEDEPKYVKGYSENQLKKVHQYQGNTPYCGPFGLAMISELLTGKTTSGDEVNAFLERNHKKNKNVGIPGHPLAEGAQLFLPNNEVSYQKHGTIEQLKQNVDAGKLTMVGVSWQTTGEILELMFVKNPANDMLKKVTVGHWLIVAGYNDTKGEIILLDPGNDPSKEASEFTPYTYTEFETYWTEKSNLFIGSGDMITFN